MSHLLVFHTATARLFAIHIVSPFEFLKVDSTNSSRSSPPNEFPPPCVGCKHSAMRSTLHVHLGIGGLLCSSCLSQIHWPFSQLQNRHPCATQSKTSCCSSVKDSRDCSLIQSCCFRGTRGKRMILIITELIAVTTTSAIKHHFLYTMHIACT